MKKFINVLTRQAANPVFLSIGLENAIAGES